MKPIHLNLAVAAFPRLPARLLRRSWLMAVHRAALALYNAQIACVSSLSTKDDARKHRQARAQIADEQRHTALANASSASISSSWHRRPSSRTRSSPSAPSPGASCSTASRACCRTTCGFSA